MVYIDKDNKVINMIILDNKIIEFIKVKDWILLCIYFFWINGDVLVGMRKDKEVKVMRYSRKGIEK